MKKFLAGLLISSSLLGLYGCGNDEEKSKDSSSEPSSTEVKQSKESTKDEWKQKYDGTQYNQALATIKNASAYANSKNLGKALKTVDDQTINIKHIDISTQYKGLDGKTHKASKGKSYLIVALEIKNNSETATTAIFPSIEFMGDSDKFVKEKDIPRDDEVITSVNDESANKIANQESEIKPSETIYINIGYEIASDNVRYTPLKDSGETFKHYSDLNNAVFSLGRLGQKGSDISNINVALQDQQEQ